VLVAPGYSKGKDEDPGSKIHYKKGLVEWFKV
jgi:hypothetical protein